MNNDLISRNDLEKFKILPFDKASYDDTEINAAYQNGWNDAIDRIIDNAPTVEYTFEEAFQKTVCENKLYCPARPQGEWITNGELDSKDVCSVCKKRFWYRCMTIDLNRIEDIWNFCPNCGADMRGGAENDT